MNIRGLQKVTVLDYPGLTACTIFLGGCNFRCPFCHNYDLIDKSEPVGMSEHDLMTYLKSRTKLLSGVVISGGEPTVNTGLVDLIKKIKELGYNIKLDTNGTKPKIIKELIDKQLVNYIAMDIKNALDKYSITTNVSHYGEEQILESIDLIMSSFVNYEFRTTVVKEFHDEEDFHEIGKMIRGAEAYYLQPFVDRPTVHYGNLHSPSIDDLNRYKEIMDNYVTNCQIRGV